MLVNLIDILIIYLNNYLYFLRSYIINKLYKVNIYN